MIGRVAGLHALVGVAFRFQDQPDLPGLSIECVVDTGFTGFLTLPPAAVARLELPFFSTIAADLADGSTVYVAVHIATIDWDGEERDVEVLATGARPLLGTLLLDGHELSVRFTEGGRVSIDAL
ncbi:MAG: clan AA aspartic protease [Dehalococcoidia bacterium]